MPLAMNQIIFSSEVLTVQTPDVDLAVRVGEIGPLVVLLHGFPDTWRTWDAMEPALQKAGFRTANLALRGYAPSGLPRNKDYSLTALAGDVIAVLDHLGEDRAHLLGHDWGATIAYAVAALHPQRVARMVTLADPPPSLFPSGWRERLARPHNIYLRQGALSAWLLHRQNAQLVDHLYRQWSPNWAVPTAHLTHVRHALRHLERARAAVDYYAAGMSEEERVVMLRRLPTPTLAIYGADEPDVRREAFVGVRKVLGPGSQTAEIPGVGHWPHLEAPDDVAQTAIGFLQG